MQTGCQQGGTKSSHGADPSPHNIIIKKEYNYRNVSQVLT